MLLRLIELKFGAPDEALRNRIESADSERESPEQILLGDIEKYDVQRVWSSRRLRVFRRANRRAELVEHLSGGGRTVR